MFTIGIDDSARAPLIGPMFMAGVILDESQEAELKAKGIKDSKVLSQARREKLCKIIKDTATKHMILESSPIDIDNSIKSGVNLNTIEAQKSAQIINTFLKKINEPVKVVIDCPSNNISAWKNTVLQYVDEDKHKIINLICEHKADANHISVSAASIIAKCAREAAVEQLKAKFGSFGSGYPADPRTIIFLKKHGKTLANSGIFRKTWATWKAIFPNE